MISRKIIDSINSSSWVGEIFAEAERLKCAYGPDKVFDFSIGNPQIEPPKPVKEALTNIITGDKPGIHRYTSNAGNDDVRAKIARFINEEEGTDLTGKNVVMTCGAAGGLNIVLKALLNPGDEVIVFSPYFVDYLFYIDNHGGKPVIVPTNPKNFEPDINKLSDYITSGTKAVIINSPNNPTGIVYSRKVLEDMARLLIEKENLYGNPIYLISDETYKKIVYDGIEVPSVLNIFKNSILVNSFSKSFAMPGERIGYAVVNSSAAECDMLAEGLGLCNRTLGFFNAPSLFQRVVSEAFNENVDIEVYRKRRDLMYDVITKVGFNCEKPSGAFYMLIKSPIPDDVEFVKLALRYNLLLFPGTGFGYPGYFRVSYCVGLDTIENSINAFMALKQELKKSAE